MRVVHDRRRTRQETDAVTVEDLLAMQAHDPMLLDGEYRTEPVRAAGGFLPPPGTRARRASAPPREPESRLAKAAKLAGLTTAASLLVGAVVAASMVTKERPAEAGRGALEPPRITGAAALGGFVPSTGKPPAGSRDVRQSQAPVSVSQVPVAATEQTAAAPAGTSAPTTTTSSQEPSDADKLKAVRQFYRRMASDRPEDALAMLTPDLAGDEPGDLVRAWSSMKDVHVDDVEVQPDGTVRAVVTLKQQDGTKLRVTQVLTLAAGTAEQISGAVLLSAEQL
ncbi:hypothetical protein FPZ12_036605 [Amycolatopsis acidicola]|uniref:Uncharacterized protein n=1 Tax=Amycolatopsis acidicola TaxID=2596893 RepID=A0A5N0UV23_9PSEU|nr:hypothetical protein [Amycolatopsis acidicola]KAA9152559.1 hypothetical protein FPZ12_036605 [Amycolatopsis acidicola]